MRASILLLAVILLTAPARSAEFAVLDAAAVPGMDAAGRAAYDTFLVANLPRAFAVAANGRFGWASRAAGLEAARAEALRLCAEHGGTDCAPYAENLDVVWRGHALDAPRPPGPLVETFNYALVPDARYLWRGPARAAGVYVWAHGKNPNGADSRGIQPQPHVRWFNNAGYDVVGFERAPLPDEVNRAAGWLRDGLATLRGRGYRRVVVGGQSRGGWNALQALDTAGLADAVIAVSPAAQGFGSSTNLASQTDEFRAMMAGAPPQRARVALVQFQNDLFMGDGDARSRMLRTILAPKVAAILLVDRPDGFSGHGAANAAGFGQTFGACLLAFATAATPLDRC